MCEFKTSKEWLGESEAHWFTILQLPAHWDIVTNSTQVFTIFTNPSARAGYDTRSIFKRSLTGLRLVASPRLKNLVCPTIYP